MKNPVQANAEAVVKPGSCKAAGKNAAAKVSSSKCRRPRASHLAMESARSTAKLTVYFGEVSIQVTRPSEQSVQKGIKASAKVIKDLGKCLLTPGLEIQQSEDIPIFAADPQNPTRVIRQLNGKSEVGSFVRGKFKATP